MYAIIASAGPWWTWEQCDAAGRTIPYGYASLPYRTRERAEASAREHGLTPVSPVVPAAPAATRRRSWLRRSTELRRQRRNPTQRPGASTAAATTTSTANSSACRRSA
jgi:hypothetical protein